MMDRKQNVFIIIHTMKTNSTTISTAVHLITERSDFRTSNAVSEQFS